jgi:hypothetical protein
VPDKYVNNNACFNRFLQTRSFGLFGDFGVWDNEGVGQFSTSNILGNVILTLPDGVAAELVGRIVDFVKEKD